jgi:hypothetical protein
MEGRRGKERKALNALLCGVELVKSMKAVLTE